MVNTVAEILARHRNGAVAPAETIKQCYGRIRALADPGIFITLRDENEATAEAVTLSGKRAQGPLFGVPVAIKDNTDVAGLPTTAACPAFTYQPAVDATAVAKLRAAGAIVIGKTNLDQFATGLVGTRTPYPIPRNPLRGDLIPGGSSSGSAVAVAAGIVPIALGTDTAGSGRVPAMLNNIVGLKPSLGTRIKPRRRTGLPDTRLRVDIRCRNRWRLDGAGRNRGIRSGRSLFTRTSPRRTRVNAGRVQTRRPARKSTPFLRR